jgi:hypothetical protein
MPEARARERKAKCFVNALLRQWRLPRNQRGRPTEDYEKSSPALTELLRKSMVQLADVLNPQTQLLTGLQEEAP